MPRTLVRRPLVRRTLATALALASIAASACIPYTVGSTAQTVPAGRSTRTSTSYFIPNAVRSPDDSLAGPMFGNDLEYRHGLDARSDFGLRLVPGGAVVNYKRRLGADTSHTRAGWAVMGGGGIVNFGSHAHVEATLIASGRQDRPVSAYGGLRAMQVAPITMGAVHDSPTIGFFGGLQLGDAQFTLRPELGVFYDRSALGLRSADVILVPSITLQRGRRTRESRQERREGGGWLPRGVRLPGF
jgi:hypothetical protein